MKIKFHYTMYLLLLICFFCDFLYETLMMFIILILHELGHIIFLKKYKRNISSVTFYPFGGIIKHESGCNDKITNELLITCGGLLVNIILAFIFYFLNLEVWFILNLSVIIFNIVPIYPLDGGKILHCFLNLFLCYKKTIYVSIVVSVSTIMLILMLNYIYCFSLYIYLLMFALFNINIKRIFTIKNEYKYFLANKYLYPNDDLKEKRIYRFNKPLNKIYQGRNCIFILDEIKIKERELLNKYFSYN